MEFIIWSGIQTTDNEKIKHPTSQVGRSARVEVNSDGRGDRGGAYSERVVWGGFSVQEPRRMRSHAQNVAGTGQAP